MEALPIGRFMTDQNSPESPSNLKSRISTRSFRCLHKFVVRYNNYSTAAYESVLGHVAKYFYWDVSGDLNNLERGKVMVPRL